MDDKRIAAAEHKHLIPLDRINGYDVRPGFYGINGATALREGVNFTVCSVEATDVELLLYHRGEKEPYAVLPFPKHYRIGGVYSMFVFGLDIFDFEYAYRVHMSPKKVLFLTDQSRFWIPMQKQSPVRVYGANSLIRTMSTGQEWLSMILTGVIMWIRSDRLRI